MASVSPSRNPGHHEGLPPGRSEKGSLLRPRVASALHETMKTIPAFGSFSFCFGFIVPGRHDVGKRVNLALARFSLHQHLHPHNLFRSKGWLRGS